MPQTCRTGLIKDLEKDVLEWPRLVVLSRTFKGFVENRGAWLGICHMFGRNNKDLGCFIWIGRQNLAPWIAGKSAVVAFQKPMRSHSCYQIYRSRKQLEVFITQYLNTKTRCWEKLTESGEIEGTWPLAKTKNIINVLKFCRRVHYFNYQSQVAAGFT